MSAVFGVVLFLGIIAGAWQFFSATPPAETLATVLLAIALALTPVQWIAAFAVLAGLTGLVIIMVTLLAPQPAGVDDDAARRIAAEVLATFERASSQIAAEVRKSAQPDDEDSRSTLRRANGVRALKPMESSLEIGRLPNGVFGFVDVLYLISPRFSFNTVRMKIPQDDDTLANVLSRRRASAVWSHARLEFHKLPNGRAFVVGFASAADGLRLHENRSANIWLLTRPWQEATTLTQVDAARVRDTQVYGLPDSSAVRLELTLSESSSPLPPSPAPPSSTA